MHRKIESNASTIEEIIQELKTQKQVKELKSTDQEDAYAMQKLEKPDICNKNI